MSVTATTSMWWTWRAERAAPQGTGILWEARPRADGCLARHCERSAAVHAFGSHGLLHFVRNDGGVHGKLCVAGMVNKHGLPRRWRAFP